MELLLWELHVPLPEILETKTVARSRLFSIETLKLRFSNGVERLYERLPARGRQAVIVVAINTDDEVILVREYLAGLHRWCRFAVLIEPVCQSGQTVVVEEGFIPIFPEG